MKTFITDDFLLKTETARRLYHEYAAPMPIIDYHNHLPPAQVANDHQFENITQVWLYGDHYKWRAMRTNGIPERYATGDASDYEKFAKWAETVPYTARNPLYHWTHLELLRYFDIDELLTPETARSIYDQCSEKVRSPEFSARNLLRKMNVEVVATTDDPTDSLADHARYAAEGADLLMVPTFRPDKAMMPFDTVAFGQYVERLATVSGIAITEFSEFLKALEARCDFFASLGCRASDHGLEQVWAEPCTEWEAAALFGRLLEGETLSTAEVRQFGSFMLVWFGQQDHSRGWVQQYHLGALRNNNSRLLKKLGPDTGWDSIGDFNQAQPLSRLLDRLDSNDQLARTILYNLNPADNELMATMIGNFQDGTVPGKLQFGSGWWFLDQKDGMEKQINALSNMGLLSRFVGMLTDSRSFLSFPRHEYFRRILCNMLGQDVENGELPNDVAWLGKMVQDICYNNARDYFQFAGTSQPAAAGVQ
ncbi:glucuronate isomerase [Rudanella lutea]|uniref:glucuronate isomerase n=1 Tax=Rudanella lutea TaxID=451374 RepID=UPI0003648214|nr:glucuronate isomerase [Rudanella lutea]